jgi:hypothetical protein
VNGHDGIHGILLGTQHHLELFRTNGGRQFFQIPAYFRQGLLVFLRCCQFIKFIEIVNRTFERPPMADDMIQSRFLFQDITGLFLVVPEILTQGKRFQLFDVVVFVGDVKDILRVDRFFFLHS